MVRQRSSNSFDGSVRSTPAQGLADAVCFRVCRDRSGFGLYAPSPQEGAGTLAVSTQARFHMFWSCSRSRRRIAWWMSERPLLAGWSLAASAPNRTFKHFGALIACLESRQIGQLISYLSHFRPSLESEDCTQHRYRNEQLEFWHMPVQYHAYRTSTERRLGTAKWLGSMSRKV